MINLYKIGLYPRLLVKLTTATALALTLCISACTTKPTEYKWLTVKAPFLDIRTGPGRGYPITHSVLRGERIEVLFQRTGYFKVRTPDNIEGWTDAGPLLDPKSAQPTPIDR